MGRDYALTADGIPAGGERNRAVALLVAMRPYQWPKNALVFAAFAFSAGQAWTPREPDTWWPLLWRNAALFACWCLLASATYLVNDARDRDADRFHPRKQLRPIASGQVSPTTAWAAAVLLSGIALPVALILSITAGSILAGYLVVMTAYSFGLKRVAILDVLILTGGVAARAVSGAAAIDVAISPWLYVCAGFAAFFFASSKRWAEFRQLGADAAIHRPALAHYTGEILSQLLVISAATALLSYALYTIESRNVPTNGAMAWTIPFVAFGLFRYLLLLNGARSTDAPDQIVFTDPQILIAVAGFVGTAMTVLLLN
ncbi:MAG: UbiA prenyltransferase family protein [Chloroflexi bacterium]|nr:UbiA prenyltransferase family protein [Chloroflexota bacterium]